MLFSVPSFSMLVLQQIRNEDTMIALYLKHKQEREALGIPPKPLNEDQVRELTGLLAAPGDLDPAFLLDLIAHRVPAGVDPAARVKAEFLAGVAAGKTASPVIPPEKAVFLLGTMRGGYNIAPLIALLDHEKLASYAADALSGIILVSDDAFDDIFRLSERNSHARHVVDSWATAGWFTQSPPLPESILVKVFKVDGEINTDDFSPAGEAWSRPDIPLHARAMLSRRIDSPLETIAALKTKEGHPLAFVGDVVGTGSSRKSAANSLLWHIGDDIPHVPNKRRGGVVLGGKIAPIFFNSLEDAGALPIECDVSKIQNGDRITIYPYSGKVVRTESGEPLAEFTLKTKGIPDAFRAGGRIPLIIGRSLTDRTRKKLGLGPSDAFARPQAPPDTGKGFTLAQKMVGRACSLPGVRPGTYCEPKISTVGSQDTTGPMTRDELAELACLKFNADLVLQSFCHTAAYPRPVDVGMQGSLHDFMKVRGGIALRPGDGIIHTWLNRMVLPDTVGTGGDSHTRFPVGISFPAGSGLVAFAAAIGCMPLDMPESVLVRFSGKPRPGITIRDLVNAIPCAAIRQGHLTVEKSGKKNIFSGRIIEIEGLSDLTVQEAYELTNGSAERSASAAVIALSEAAVSAFLKENIAVLNGMLAEGYGDAETIKRRIAAMEAWLSAPALLKSDTDADYAAVIDIDLDAVTEPILACPNDPDDVRPLSEIAGTPVDEVFIGSCMTGIDQFRKAGKLLEGSRQVPVRLWLAPGIRMEALQLKKEGFYSIFGRAGARIEIPGCSLCMGNQARVTDNTTVFSTSTRNFPNRMGDNTRVYLGSAELAAITAILGRIPSLDEYMEAYKRVLD